MTQRDSLGGACGPGRMNDQSEIARSRHMRCGGLDGMFLPGRKRKSVKDRKVCTKRACKKTILKTFIGAFKITQEKAASDHFEQASLLGLGLLGIDGRNRCPCCENGKASRHPERTVGSKYANGLAGANASVLKRLRNIPGPLD